MGGVPLTGPGQAGQGQDAAIQLFHIDKRVKKCHTALQINAVILTSRKHAEKPISLLNSRSRPDETGVHITVICAPCRAGGKKRRRECIC